MLMTGHSNQFGNKALLQFQQISSQTYVQKSAPYEDP